MKDIEEKVMTQEEKAKRFDEVLAMAKECITYVPDNAVNQYLLDMFPELKESEDDDIRKKLISFFQRFPYENLENAGLSAKDAITWLEKQGEPKSAKNIVETWKDMRLEVHQQASGNRNESNCSDDTTKMFSLNDIDEIIEKMSEQKPADKVEPTDYNSIDPHFSKPIDKVEPMFKNGQWIVWRDKCYKVNYNGCGYELVDQNGLSTSLEYGTIDENAHLWDITKDAKNGDVLVASDGSLFIFAKVKDNSAYYHFSLCKNGSKEISDGNHSWETANSCHPATKEQRDQLEKAMTNAGWEFDFDKKELKKIEQKFNIGDEIKTANEEPLTITKIDEKGYWSEDLFICGFDDTAKWEVVGQKTAWSEEDKRCEDI